MSEENKAIYHRVAEDIWNKKNPALIDEMYASNCLIHIPDGVLHGLEGYRELYNTYVAAFPDCQLSIEDTLAEGDKVMIHYTYSGTHNGDLMGIAPTGKPVSVKGTAFARFAGGKIVEERTVWNTLGMMQQIGAVPPLGQAAGAE